MDNDNGTQSQRDLFAARLEEALAALSGAPGRVYGRNVWLSEQMAERGRKITTETARRWFAGLSVPHHRTLDALADVLGVDPRFLTGETEDRTPRQRKAVYERMTADPAPEAAPAARPLPPTAPFTAAKFLECWATLAGTPGRADGRQLVLEAGSGSASIMVLVIAGQWSEIQFPDMFGSLRKSLPHAVVALGEGGALPRVFILPAPLVERLGGPGGSAIVENAPDGLVVEGAGMVLKPLEAISGIYDML